MRLCFFNALKYTNLKEKRVKASLVIGQQSIRRKEMIKDLVILANDLDSKGLRAEANCLDSIIQKMATELGEPVSVYDWEDQNPEPMWNEAEFDNQGDAYEMDSEYKGKMDTWTMRRDDFILRNIESQIEVLKERVQGANSLDEINQVAERISALIQERDSHSKANERRRMDNYIEWYDNLPPHEQYEHDRGNAFQDRYERFRNEY